MENENVKMTPNEVDIVFEEEFVSPDVEGIAYLSAKAACWTE